MISPASLPSLIFPSVFPDLPHNFLETSREDWLEKGEPLLREYQALIPKTIRAGLAGDWAKWEQSLVERDRVADKIRAFGYNPVFHIGDREYQKRILEILQKEKPLTDMASLERVYRRGLRAWRDGGLCLTGRPGPRSGAYPDNAAADSTVAACKRGEAEGLGDCTQIARRVAMTMASALSVYRGPAVRMNWQEIYRIPGPGEGHAFISLTSGGRRVALDPVEVGFELSPRLYREGEVWRLSMSSFYDNELSGHNRSREPQKRAGTVRRSYAIDPEGSTLPLQLAVSFVLEGDVSTAKATLAEAKTISRDPRLRGLLGELILRQEKNPAGAKPHFLDALKTDPSYGAAFLGLRKSLLKAEAPAVFDLSRLGEADLSAERKAYLQALALFPWTASSLFDLSRDLLHPVFVRLRAASGRPETALFGDLENFHRVLAAETVIGQLTKQTGEGNRFQAELGAIALVQGLFLENAGNRTLADAKFLQAASILKKGLEHADDPALLMDLLRFVIERQKAAKKP